MDLEQLREQLEIDEGVKYEVYNDHLGYATFGVGHLVLDEDFDDLPEEAQQVIANMMFNMGRPRLSKFKGMKRGVDSRDWNAAADEMVDSAWYRQVTNRANRLVDRIRALS